MTYNQDNQRDNASPGQSIDTRVLPIIEETLQIEKRLVETGGFRLTKTVSVEDETVDVALVSSELHVERHAINRVIADGAAPAVRQDGATTIYPIVKEVLVTEKRLLLVAEVHVRRVDLTFHEPQTVSLRKEEIVIERMDDAITPSTKQP